ncbi:MAG: MATE family efflux transporter [Gammaproteobacteria bacterium TMED182]|nr:MAG: MATE family efflux transporter [Gammaproteobacteria bacterium TMED182]
MMTEQSNKSPIPPRPVASASRDMTEGTVSSHLVRLTGFMLFGFVAVMGANLMESLYIGRVGTLELAALGFTFPLVMTLQGMTMGLGVGASSVVARSIGASDWPRARRLITHSFLLVIAFVTIVAVVIYFSLEALFTLLGANDEARALASDYMTIWLLGLPFFAIAMVGSSLMRAAGDAVKPSYLMTVGAVIQVLIGPAFIFGVGGFEGYGLAGAALAFVVARTLSFLMYVYYAVKDRLIVFSLGGLLSSSRAILHVGLPAIAANLISPISLTVVTRLLAGHGEAVVAGFSVASRIETMLAMVMWALSMSVAPFVGQNWGARQYDRVRGALRSANIFALAWGALAFLCLYLLGPGLIALVNDDPAVIEAASSYLLIIPLGMGMMGIVANSTSSFNALGMPGPPLIISVTQMLFLSVPLALLGNYLMGYQGIFIGSVVAIVITAVTSFVWLRLTLKRRIRAALKEG